VESAGKKVAGKATQIKKGENVGYNRTCFSLIFFRSLPINYSYK